MNLWCIDIINIIYLLAEFIQSLTRKLMIKFFFSFYFIQFYIHFYAISTYMLSHLITFKYLFSGYQQDMRMYADSTRTWAAPHPTQKGFVLHDTQEPRYLNGGDHSLCNNQMSHPSSTYPTSSSLFNQTQATSASPQHRNAVSFYFIFIS